MDDAAFDTATRRVPALLTRRRSLGVLSVLGLGAGLLTNDAEAKKRRKKKKRKNKKGNQPLTCTGCTVCETCVNGVCQPVADGTTCGTDAVCRHNVCGRTCTPLTPGQCPAGKSCLDSSADGQANVCVTTGFGFCAQPACTDDASCPPGSVCGIQNCSLGAPFPKRLCLVVDQV